MNNTVVFITALPLEFEAVATYLENRQEKTISEGNVYETGEYVTPTGVQWAVVVTEAGQGNPKAALETERAIQTFNPVYTFFVGVAGGIKDVKLGDVVAAEVIKGYERGKAGQTFLPRGEVGRASFILVERAKANARNKRWLSKIKGKDTSQSGAKVATIVAGEKVVASTRSETYRLIKKNYSEAVAVEMEGIGFLIAMWANVGVQGIVIRGISDLLVKKTPARDKQWQPIAAGNAAAFAFAMLDDLNIEKTIEKTIEQVGNYLPDSGILTSHAKRDKARKEARRMLAEEQVQKKLAKDSLKVVENELFNTEERNGVENDIFECMRWLVYSLDELGVAADVNSLKEGFTLGEIKIYKLALKHIRDVEIPPLLENSPEATSKAQEYINILIDKLE